MKCRSELITDEIDTAINTAGLVLRRECELFVGDDRKLASGPAVGKGKAFLDWLIREVDRKVAAMEMESAGVYDAALIRTPAPRAIAFRGISDYADARKKKIEDTAKGRFRSLAAQNAISLLIRGIQAGLFERDAPSQSQSESIFVTAAATESRVKSVFVIGGVTGETSDPDAELPRLHNAALKLGRHIAMAGAQLIICSPFPDSADYYVAVGYAEGQNAGVIQLHCPSHPKVSEKRDLLAGSLGREGLTIQDWTYPGPESEESWPQAWLLAQLYALEMADVVVALGGKVSNTANTLLHLAESKGVPIIPFSFLGGAARRAFGRRDWRQLNPALDTSVMERDNGVDETIQVANRLIVDRVARAFDFSGAPRTVFVSFARQNSGIANEVILFLKSRGLVVMTGESEKRTDQLIPVSINDAMLKSNVCVALWSQHYATSPWCYDELDLAVERQALGQISLWLFNLDDSPIVPKQARSLTSISARNSTAIIKVAEEILSRYAL